MESGKKKSVVGILENSHLHAIGPLQTWEGNNRAQVIGLLSFPILLHYDPVWDHALPQPHPIYCVWLFNNSPMAVLRVLCDPNFLGASPCSAAS